MNAATNDIIDGLSRDLRPVGRNAARRRLLVGAGLGGVVAAAAMIVWLGLRPDLSEAVLGSVFWIKALYTALLSLSGYLVVERLGRPGESARKGMATGLAALLAVFVLAVAQVALSPDRDPAMLFGHTASFCPVAILVLSAPVFAGTVSAMRRLAPTRLTLAGAGAGFVSGSIAAFIYSFSCAEQGVPFLATWYTLGTLAATCVGALLGRPLLRW